MGERGRGTVESGGIESDPSSIRGGFWTKTTALGDSGKSHRTLDE